MSSPRRRREELLTLLYGEPRGHEVAARLDAQLDAWPAQRAQLPHQRERPLDERAAWIIAYPDHLTDLAFTPLDALDRFVVAHLAPLISGVHTLPVHPSTSDGGFSVVDHAVVDPAFGGWADLERLAGHSTWLADLVINHVSAQGTWFTGFLAGDPKYADFFLPLTDDVDTTAVVRPRTSPLAHRYLARDGSEHRLWTTFSPDQVDLDFTNPAVLLAMVEVLLRFVHHGATAIRLDAIAFVWKDPATPSVHLPQTHAIVQLLRACLDEVAPSVLLITETNVPHAENVSYFGDGSYPEADAVYQFALPPLVLHAVLTGSTSALRSWLTGLEPPPGGRTFLQFLASHDGIGLRPVEGLLADAQLHELVAATRAAGGVVNERQVDGTTEPYELAVTWFALMANGVDPDDAIRRHLASHAVVLALQGVPLLYLGSLFAIGNDTTAFARTGHGRDLNRRRLRSAEVEATLDDEGSSAARVWSGLRGMLAIRWSSPAFHPASAQIVHHSPDGTLLIERRAAGGERAVVAVNLSARPHVVDLPPGRWSRAGQPWGPNRPPPVGGTTILEPWSSQWLLAVA